MANLMDSMENDDFYKEQYGGFEEEENDKEFVYQSPNEDEDHDEVDSDFSIDENDEDDEDDEDEEKEKKKILKQFSKLSLKELQVFNN